MNRYMLHAHVHDMCMCMHMHMLPSKITSLVYLPRAKGNGGQGAWEAGLGSRGMEGRRGGTAARGINHVRTYFMKSETGGLKFHEIS